MTILLCLQEGKDPTIYSKLWNFILFSEQHMSLVNLKYAFGSAYLRAVLLSPSPIPEY